MVGIVSCRVDVSPTVEGPTVEGRFAGFFRMYPEDALVWEVSSAGWTSVLNLKAEGLCLLTCVVERVGYEDLEELGGVGEYWNE